MLFSCIIGSDGWCLWTENSHHGCKDADFLRRMISFTMSPMACGLTLLLLPLASPAIELQCPQSFATQSLGVQNIIHPSQTYQRIGGQLTPSSCAASSPQSASDSSVQGLIYLPSTSREEDFNSKIAKNDNIILEVSTSDNPSVILAGAKIPISQIKAFPISFGISKDNLLLKEPADESNSSQEQFWDQAVLYYPKDLLIRARICPSSSFCKDSEATFQGGGISKLLLLPDANDDFKLSRAAASIRLAQSSTPDVLFTW